MSLNLSVLSDVRLTKDAAVNQLGSSGDYSKVLMTVASSRENPNDDATDFIDLQLIMKSDSKGLRYLEDKLIKGKRISATGEIHVDRWRDDENSDNWHTRHYVFIKRYSDLSIVDYQPTSQV